MTDPLGLHWRQPPPEAILVDDMHALMSEQTFKELSEYSATMPTGVYPGKMWRRHDGLFDRNCPPERRRWLLCWWTYLDETHCKFEFREVLLA